MLGAVVSRIVVAVSDVFVRRLTPALASFVRGECEFRVLDIQRPDAELRRLIHSSRPSAVITEWKPGTTEMIVGLGYPTVIADTDEVFPGAVSIDVDDRLVGENAARFFLAAGYRSLGCASLDTPYGEQRLDGFCGFLAKQKISCEVHRHVEPKQRRYMESGESPGMKLRSWLRQLPMPVAIFAVHDPLGRLICEAALAEGLQVPDDVAVLGVNNDELVCGLSYPPLSSVAIPWDQIGALAGKWAQFLIDKKRAPKKSLLVQPGMVAVRRSTALTAVDDGDLRRVLRYFRERHREGITIASMCGELRISRRAVERKFAALLDTSPRKTLLRMRVETARSLLLGTDLSMALVAERSGFSNAEQFSVGFRRLTGQSPSAFRKKARGEPGS